MSEIPMDPKGKRPRFFPESGADESVTMILELMSEVWVVKERLYALEKVVEDAGLSVADQLEAWKPTDEQAGELDEQRKRFIQTVLRSLEANFTPGLHLRRSLDERAERDDDGELRTDLVRAA